MPIKLLSYACHQSHLIGTTLAPRQQYTLSSFLDAMMANPPQQVCSLCTRNCCVYCIKWMVLFGHKLAEKCLLLCHLSSFLWLKQCLNCPIMHVCCLYCLSWVYFIKRMASFGQELARKCPFSCCQSCCMFFLCIAGMTSWWVPLSNLCQVTLTLNVSSWYVTNTFTAFTLFYIHQIAAALPASLGGSAFAHYDGAVHGDGKFLYVLSITTNEQHSSELNEDESDDDDKEIPLCLLFQTISLWSPPFQEATILNHHASQPATCLMTNFLTCSLVVVNTSYSPMALAYQWCQKMEICWRA